jgi:hypothetical protein
MLDQSLDGIDERFCLVFRPDRSALVNEAIARPNAFGVASPPRRRRQAVARESRPEGLDSIGVCAEALPSHIPTRDPFRKSRFDLTVHERRANSGGERNLSRRLRNDDGRPVLSSSEELARRGDKRGRSPARLVQRGLVTVTGHTFPSRMAGWLGVFLLGLHVMLRPLEDD